MKIALSTSNKVPGVFVLWKASLEVFRWLGFSQHPCCVDMLYVLPVCVNPWVKKNEEEVAEGEPVTEEDMGPPPPPPEAVRQVKSVPLWFAFLAFYHINKGGYTVCLSAFLLFAERYSSTAWLSRTWPKSRGRRRTRRQWTSSSWIRTSPPWSPMWTLSPGCGWSTPSPQR